MEGRYLSVVTESDLVKPDATPEEVRAVVNDDSGGQIFSQAVRGHSMLSHGLC